MKRSHEHAYDLMEMETQETEGTHISGLRTVGHSMTIMPSTMKFDEAVTVRQGERQSLLRLRGIQS